MSLLVKKGEDLYRLGKFEEALQCFDQAEDAKICEILEEKCGSLLYLGKYKEAKICADEVIYDKKCNDSQKAWALALKAEALGYIGDYKTAIETVNTISSSEKNKDKNLDCYASFVEGYALDYQGKHGQAIDYFNRVIENEHCDDGKVEALIARGITSNYMAMTQNDKSKYYNTAIWCFDEAIKKCKGEDKENNSTRYQDIAYAYINKSTSLENLKAAKKELDDCLNEALSYSNKCISLNPNDAHAWMIKGTYYFKLKFYDMAIECYNKIIMSINSEFDFAWCLKGYALNYLERYEEALRCFNEAIKTNANDPDYSIGKGISLYNLGRYDEAIECFNEDVSNGEKAYSNTVSFLRGTSFYGKHWYIEALDNFRKVGKHITLEGQKHNNIGACYYRLGLAEEARNEYIAANATSDASSESDAKFVEPYYNLGILYNDDGNIDKAKNLFKQCLEENSSFTKARDALGRLDTQSPTSEWFRYWFGRGMAKKALGVVLILSIFGLIGFIAAASTAILYNNQNIVSSSLDNQSLVTEILNINQNILSSAITGISIMIGLLIVILLLPSIRRIKVGEVELEPVAIDTKAPQHMDVVVSTMRKVGMQSF